MEAYKIENLSFTYPNCDKAAVLNVNINISQGEFITLCGKSGSGKTTLLKLLKPSLSPFGVVTGNIYFCDKLLSQTDIKEQAEKIGFVMQDVENQTVTDKVWHELAFGLESLGYSQGEIRTRVAEMASFFGIGEWFHKKTDELSGGQKQILNLASVMVMQPSVLILDEPTSQLDPIAAQEFINTLVKINRELGTTIIMTEHRIDEIFPISDRVIVMDDGYVIADGSPKTVADILKKSKHEMYFALPAQVRIYASVSDGTDYPLTVKEGKDWLESYVNGNLIKKDTDFSNKEIEKNTDTVTEVKDVWYRYEKNLPDVIKGMNLKVNKGELFAILGGNGAGKSTALSLISGLNKAYRGKILINGKNIYETDDLYGGTLSMLTQNPQALFVKKSVYLDLEEILDDKKISKEEKKIKIENIASLCRIENLLNRHPYDLSGGEQQRAALAKVLLRSPEILLLDEPTKGMDKGFKDIFADILCDLKKAGVTVIMVSHDIEFCAEYADRCAMFFDGNITSVGDAGSFFKNKSFYTTVANRMARNIIPNAVLTSDVIYALGGKEEKRKTEAVDFKFDNIKNEKKENKKKNTFDIKKVFGVLFLILFFMTSIIGKMSQNTDILFSLKIMASISVIGSFICLFGGKEVGIYSIDSEKKKLSKRTLVAMFFILLAVPLTVYMGTTFLQDRKYYFISLLIILETIIPFIAVFESRKPQARELIVISVLCAIGVLGRTAFITVPEFKPVIAIVIISGVCFGGETGFLVGAITGFVSNFFFGQGPWTPWQMFAFGIIGFLGGILFDKGRLKKTKLSLCTFGGLSTIIIYGGIINPSSLIIWQDSINIKMIISSYVMGLPFDMVHALSTIFFLWFISEPMIDKIERIKLKYGILEC